MATAREVAQRSIVLTLSEDEAEALLTILRCVGGPTINSPREHIEAIESALYALDVAYHDGWVEYPREVYFQE